MIFKNRHEAGKQLAEALIKPIGKNPAIILGLARGGVIIAYEIAQKLQVPFGIVMTRKIGAPENPELAIGAITETGDGYFDEKMIARMGVSKQYIATAVEREKEEANHRLELYGQKPLKSEGKTVIIVDDGIATGATMMAAILSVKKQRAKRIIAAAPVAPPESVHFIESAADEVICLFVTENFYGVSQFYQDFPQVTDEEILEVLT